MRVGIVGGGQLGRMLAHAAAPLGLEVRVLATSAGDPAAQVAPAVIARGYDDVDALIELAGSVDVLTYEFENVPAGPLAQAVERTGVRVAPSIHALAVASDRLEEKTTFQRLGIPTAEFEDVPDEAALGAATRAFGFPTVLKTRRLGYDGKGQRVLRRPEDVVGALAALGHQACIVERFVDFRREVSIVAARATDGQVALYPLVENEHRGGILYRTRTLGPAAAERAADAARAAESAVRALLARLEYVGVLALEMFEREDGTLIANEIAPRVHNSGHWTMDGAATSQFEQHLRAITGMPLGSTNERAPSAMINLVGVLPDLTPLEPLEGVHIHLYGKEPRPGRKLGHVNVVASSPEALTERLATVEQHVHWSV